MNWRRFDTLGLRLFLLMWVTLVASHLVAFGLARPDLPAPPAAGGPPGLPGPGGPPPRPGAPPEPPPLPPLATLPPADLPASAWWLDLGLRSLLMALGAALGARWLARPMRRLSQAAALLSQRLARREPLPRLDAASGTVEVRRGAAVFNAMAQRLQEQFDARGMHLAAVSHDLRTPLARLRMRLEAAPPALAAAASADIHEISELIDATLAVLHEQRSGSAASVVQLRPLLEAVADDLAAAGQPVDVRPGPALRALARPAALRRIVGNLVDNALRYGGRAELHLEAGAGGGVAVHVDDAGPGLPPARLEAVFQPWAREPGAAAQPGHGLGLAIARDLAERDGGRLTLANRPEGGLRATLWLPAAPAPQASSAP